MLEAQRWVLAVMALFPERRDADGTFTPLVSRPLGSARALELLHADGLHDSNDVRRELVLLDAAARRADPVWNRARSVLVAARAHTAYLLPLDEAWSHALEGARHIQQRCRGWFSMAEACLTGLAAHHGANAGALAREHFYTLHARPDSPWNEVPWQTVLPDRLPPPDDRPALVEVHDGPTLTEALARATPGQTLRLMPGHYRGTFATEVAGLTLTGGPEVFLEHVGLASEPLLRVDAPTALHDLTLRGPSHATLVSGQSDFLHLSDCELEGGHCGLVWRGRYLQVKASRVAPAGPSALDLAAGHVVLADATLEGTVSLGPDCAFIRADATRVRGDLRLIPRVTSLSARLTKLELSGKFDFQANAAVILHDSRLDEGLLFSGGELHLERCQLGATSHISHATAHLRDCHFLASKLGNLVLGEGQITTCVGGQLAGVESPDHANLAILGGRVRLEGVALGPSAGPNLSASAARLELHAVTLSSSGGDACTLEDVVTSGAGLRIRGPAGRGLVVSRGALGLAEVDLAETGRSALVVEHEAELAIVGLGLRAPATAGQDRAIHLRGGARVLIRDLVATHAEAQLRVEDDGTRVAVVAPQVEVRASVREALLALSGARIPTSGLVAELATIELEASILAPAALALTASELHLRKVEADTGAFVLDGTSKLFRDEPAPPTTAISPLLVSPRRDPFVAWGLTGEVGELASVARVLARRMGYLDRLGLRETAQGLRVDGPLPVVARFAPALNALLQRPGALGLALAEALDLAPRAAT
jgi:hypothetical protein